MGRYARGRFPNFGDRDLGFERFGGGAFRFGRRRDRLDTGALARAGFGVDRFLRVVVGVKYCDAVCETSGFLGRIEGVRSAGGGAFRLV